jgi:hypothetical protein
MENTLLKDIPLLLKQFVSLTGICAATTSGSANVISTHYFFYQPLGPLSFYLTWRSQTYRIQRSPMNSRFHYLNCSIIARLHRHIRRQWHLGEAKRPWVRVFRGTDDLEYGYHGERHVWGSAAGTVGPESEVHVEECCGVPLEPSGLEGDGAPGCGPESAVCSCGVAAAWKGERC